MSLDIIDMTGSRIISRNVEGQDDYSINVSQLPRGIYFVRIKTVNEVITRKFIKE
ncbi:MAG: T9SS type A sorting domain-containing protein [Bacteroidales bacterium]